LLLKQKVIPLQHWPIEIYTFSVRTVQLAKTSFDQRESLVGPPFQCHTTRKLIVALSSINVVKRQVLRGLAFDATKLNFRRIGDILFQFDENRRHSFFCPDGKPLTHESRNSRGY